MGTVATSKCLLPLNDVADDPALFVGPSLETYRKNGDVWALPVDAACQVAVSRPDLLQALDTEVPADWADLMQLGERARREGQWLSIGLKGVHSLMTFYTLMANLGTPCAISRQEAFADRDAALHALGLLRSLWSCARHRSSIGTALPFTTPWCVRMIWSFVPLSIVMRHTPRLTSENHCAFTTCPVPKGTRARRLAERGWAFQHGREIPRRRWPMFDLRPRQGPSTHSPGITASPPMQRPGMIQPSTRCLAIATAEPGLQWTHAGSGHATMVISLSRKKAESSSSHIFEAGLAPISFSIRCSVFTLQTRRLAGHQSCETISPPP